MGVHLVVDFWGLPSSSLQPAAWLMDLLQQAATAGGMTAVCEPVRHDFSNGGMTAVLLLAESHIAIHTYPEYAYLALDIFACGRGDAYRALEVFRGQLKPARESITVVERGNEVSE